MELVARDRVGTVDVVRPTTAPLNLLGSELIAALHDTLSDIASSGPRAVVLTCTGAGADVREMVNFTPETAKAFITSLHRMCAQVRAIEAPVIALIDGPCLGAHLELAAACDIRLASSSSIFGMPEIRVGIPSVIDAWWLVQVCGLGRASALVFDGETIDAGEAERIGLVNRVFEPDVIHKEVSAYAALVAERSRFGLLEQKRVLNDWMMDAYQEAAERSIKRFVDAVMAGEFAEAMRAMLEKRPPQLS